MTEWLTYLKRGNGPGKKSLLWHPGHISDQTVAGGEMGDNMDN